MTVFGGAQDALLMLLPQCPLAPLLCCAESTPVADAAANNNTLIWFVYQISAGTGQYPGLQPNDFE